MVRDCAGASGPWAVAVAIAVEVEVAIAGNYTAFITFNKADDGNWVVIL